MIAALLVACGSSSPTTAPTGTAAPPTATPAATETAAGPTGTAGTSEAPPTQGTPTEDPAGVRIRIASTVGAGFTDTPLHAVAATLAAAGYDAQLIETADSALNIEGLANGEFDITAGDTGASLIAIQQTGAPISAIAAGPANAWTIYATSDITSCAELAGRRVAIHGQVSDSTAMLNNWIDSECAGTQPEYVVIPGSSNRLAALLAGQVDATPLELSDAIALEQEPGGGYTLLASFAEDLPDLRPTWAIANNQFLQDHPGAVQAFLEGIITEFRETNADPSHLREVVLQYGPELAEQPTFDAAVERYIELGIFDPNYGSEPSMFEYTIDFYEQAGSIQPGLTVDAVVNLDPLNAALDVLGKE